MRFIVPHRVSPSAQAVATCWTVLDQVIPSQTIRAVIAAHTARFVPHATRDRLLPGEVVLRLLITRYLLPGVPSYTATLAFLHTALTLRGAGGTSGGERSGAISHARARWGVRPIRDLFRAVCRPCASPTLQGAFCFGLRLMALDSSVEDVADTPANVRVFGRRRSQHGPSAFPQLVGTYLVECGTHCIVDADFRPWHQSPHHAAVRLLRSLDRGMLLLWDKGFHSYALIAAVLARGTHLLSAVPAQQTFDVVQFLPDDTVVARFWAAAPSRRSTQTPSMLVRIITYTLTDPARPGCGQPHRLLTSLLDPTAYPAIQLILTYHERWEIELALDEIDTHLRLAPGPLRSKTPRAVLQELYGLLLAHYAVRAVMATVAETAGIDPDRISFLGTVRILASALQIIPVLPVAQRPPALSRLLETIAKQRLPNRRNRRVPRAKKRTWTKHRVRRAQEEYSTVPLVPFATCIHILPPHDTPAFEPRCA